MKKSIIYLVAIFAFVFAQRAMCQPHLEVVWEKDLFPIEIGDAKFSVDGKWLYCVVDKIKKMDAMTGEFVSSFNNTKQPHRIYDFQISKPGNYLVTTNGGYGTTIWDTKTEDVLVVIPVDSVPMGGYSTSISASISPDEKFLLIGIYTYIDWGSTQSHKYQIINYDIKTKKEINRIDFEGSINIIQFSHDGRTFVTGSTYKAQFPQQGWRNKLVLWDAITLNKIKDIEDVEGQGGESEYQKIRYSLDDKLISYLRSSYGSWKGFLRDLLDSKLYYATILNRECSVVEFLPDSINYLTSEYIFDGDIKCFGHELFKIPNIKIDSSGIPLIGICEATQINGINYVFNHNASTKLLRQSTTVVEEPINPSFQFNITPELIQIVLINPTENINRIKIVDIDGKTVYQQNSVEITNNGIIIPNTFRTGTYFLIITTPEKEYSHKFQVVM